MIYNRNIRIVFGKRFLFVLEVLRPVSSRICFHFLECYKLEIGVGEESWLLLLSISALLVEELNSQRSLCFRDFFFFLTKQLHKRLMAEI